MHFLYLRIRPFYLHEGVLFTEVAILFRPLPLLPLSLLLYIEAAWLQFHQFSYFTHCPFKLNSVQLHRGAPSDFWSRNFPLGIIKFFKS